jgi:O-antigen/teichoic acid export membrane protein
VSARRSLGLTAATRLVVVVLSFLTVVIVSRLLAPEEIGIHSVAVALVGIAHVFRDFGVAHFLLQTPEVTRQRKRAAFTVTLAFSWSMAGLLVALHPLAARFYSDERIGNLLLLMVVTFLLLPFGAPLRTLLQRELQFKRLAAVDLCNHVVQSSVTIGAAWLGASYLSMAWGSIAGNLANVIVLLIVSPKGALDWPTRHGLREVLNFGGKSTTGTLAAALGGAAPDLVLGRTLGFADVAFFSRAKGLISLALDQLMVVVSTVYTPMFAKGVRDGRDAAVLYAQTSALLLGLTVPVIALLAVLAPTLIVSLFGEPWARSGPLGTMLCVFSLLTAPFALVGASLIAAGHVGALMRARLLIEGARVAVLFSSIFVNLEFVVLLLGLVYVVEVLQWLHSLKRYIGLSGATLLRSVWRSYGVGAITVAVPLALVLSNSHALALAPWALLLACGAAGASGWLAGLWVLRHPLRHELWLSASRSLTHLPNSGPRS